jgi:two-component system CheB/CheR fusion protein
MNPGDETINAAPADAEPTPGASAAVTAAPITTDPQEDAGAGYSGFVVGIGASAGGLEALERFFRHCPADTGAAFVVVQHLSPDHKSMMIDLLGRYTAMEVVMVEDGMVIEPDKVFLIPAGTIMRLSKSRFELRPKAPHILTLPIDIFFTSLAEACQRHAVGVVLSGTGSDGSRGAMAINAAGGFLMAQESKTAKFDGMPASVIGTGLVDAILPAEELPKRLVSHIRNMPPETLLKTAQDDAAPLSDDEAFDGILRLLLQSAGIDFHDYKTATLIRRLERRMQVRHQSGIEAYYRLVNEDRQELVTLKRELLIPVTNFFRDPDAFAMLDEKVIGHIVAEAGTGSSIRVWVAGTSTGEEAYSIAMLFMEAFERARRWPSLKIFATDVSQDSIDFASAGAYSEGIATEISQERLERFFTRNGSSFLVRPELRQTIVFAKHNLLADPPFTQMDLVSCRNTLIYFNQDAQRRALQRLQFATKPMGFMFLGSSEALSNGELGFTNFDTKHKLFQRSASAPTQSFDNQSEPYHGRVPRRTVIKHGGVQSAASNDALVFDNATKALLKQHAPPSMVVNNRNEIVHLIGNVRSFFEPREGLASLEVSRVLPDSVVPVAAALLFKAAKDNQRIVSDLIRLQGPNDTLRLVRLSVSPLMQQGEESFLLLSFEEEQARAEGETVAIDVDAETMARVEVLERELSASRESLQSTIEELETSNEELQATNEELMASNEELQSSNEELQSVNEELNTVNSEFQEKVGILNRVNADLDSMAKAVGVATVFVDRKLLLSRYSPDAVELFNVRETDLGRPLGDITNSLQYPDLMNDLEITLRTDRMIEKEVEAANGKRFLTRVLPYRVANNDRGAVATFVDITAFRDRERLQRIIDALPEHIAVLEADGTIAMVNRAWRTFARANGDPDLARSGIGRNYLDACVLDGSSASADAKTAAKGVKSVLEGSATIFTLRYPCHSPDEERWFVMNVAPVEGDEFGAIVSHVNVSD